MEMHRRYAVYVMVWCILHDNTKFTCSVQRVGKRVIRWELVSVYRFEDTSKKGKKGVEPRSKIREYPTSMERGLGEREMETGVGSKN